jgi:hypothetical protein
MGSTEREPDQSHRPAAPEAHDDHAGEGASGVDRRPSATSPGPQFLTTRRTDWRTRMWETSPDGAASSRPQVHDLRRVLRTR